METSVLFFDIDDTLMPFGEPLRDDVKAVLDQLKKNGHYIFVNTGRTSATLPKDVIEYEFDGIASGCGTEIFFHHKQVFDYRMDYKEQVAFFEDVAKYGCDALLEGSTGVAFVGNNHFPFIERAYKHYENDGIEIMAYDDPKFDLRKLCLIYDQNSDVEGILEKYKDKMDFMLREEGESPFYEVAPLGYSKATAMFMVAEMLNIPKENIYAFGDSGNDLAMLQAANHSVAMGNAVERIKEVAEFVTHPCAEDGIEFACRHYGLI